MVYEIISKYVMSITTATMLNSKQVGVCDVILHSAVCSRIREF